MGHPSDQRLSARRPGRNERMRVNKPFRSEVYAYGRDNVTGDLIQVHVRGGKKKMREVSRWLSQSLRSINE